MPLNSLVPMVFVKSVPRSVEFYRKLGFEVNNSFTPEGQSEATWAWLESGGASLMVTLASHAIEAEQQAVILCIYCEDVQSVHDTLPEQGIEVSEIEYPFYRPRGQFRVRDPDGFDITITHT